MPEPQITIKPFNALTLNELHACYKLRGEVFVVGQQICSEPDVDGVDPLCYHVMLWLGEELAGTARLLSIDSDQSIKVGRVAVAESHRGRGHGGSMMRAIRAWIGKVPGRRGTMSAQAHLEPWYERLGWHSDSGYYMEAGIKHVEMYLPPDHRA